MMVEIPHIVRLEEECHNFLYEAKNFVRDFLKAFNILYGATFAEASNYFRPATPKNGKQRSSGKPKQRSGRTIRKPSA